MKPSTNLHSISIRVDYNISLEYKKDSQKLVKKGKSFKLTWLKRKQM